MINNKYIIIAVAVIIILLCYFMGCFTDLDPATIHPGIVTKDSTKVHEGITDSSSIMWEDCCKGFVASTFTYNWDYYFSDVDDDYECIDNVDFTVYDSAGSKATYIASEEPESGTQAFTGYWDCKTPWEVTVQNGCIPPITYTYTLTMECP